MREELKRAGWKEKDLPEQRKGAKAKIAVARRLRQETTMTLQWIAQRLAMGSWTYVSNLLNAKKQKLARYCTIASPASIPCAFRSLKLSRCGHTGPVHWPVTRRCRRAIRLPHRLQFHNLESKIGLY